MYPWFEQVYQRLLRCYQQNILPQALLFDAPDNIGIDKFIGQLSSLLLCQTGKNIPCQQCQSCQLFSSSDGHPDYLNITPEDGKHIKLEAVQQVITMLLNTAYCGGVRVIVIEGVELLNTSAANALLKTLEEPNQSVYFLLTSAHPEKVMPTILSRVQRQKIVLEDAGVLPWLESRAGVEGTVTLETLVSIKQAWNLANQSPFFALTLLKGSESLKIRDALLSMLSSAENPIEMAEQSLLLGSSVEIVYWLTYIYCDLYKMQFNLSDAYIMSQDSVDALKAVAARIDPNNVYKIYRQLLKINDMRYQDLNLNQSLLLENLYINMIGEGA
jgi:DNA polymerase III subunit delta'